MGIEDQIDRLEELLREVCPHKRVGIDEGSRLADGTILYTCKICGKSQWATSVKDFRKQCEKDLDEYEL